MVKSFNHFKSIESAIVSEASKNADVMKKIVELLTPLESLDRARVVKAAFTLLGDATPDPSSSAQDSVGVDGELNLPPRAASWFRQHALSTWQLSEVFHIQGEQVEVIAAEMPGGGKKGKTINAYVLEGIRSLLASGEPLFDDKSARALCRNLGCYDDANHALNMKAGGNLWIGSKDKGWRLTTPGLKHGADLVREIAPTPK